MRSKLGIKIISISARFLRRRQKGQMSIFLLLIFPVLFVFFAMVINIGLIVHDKIALQNSVDLAAYYAAQRQAEILNEIAHINYQIRQSYKLLAWRYWVLGTAGLKQHPFDSEGPYANITLKDEDMFKGQSTSNVLPDHQAGPPFCVTHGGWREFYDLNPNKTSSTSSLCQNIKFSAQAIQPIPLSTITFDLGGMITDLVTNVNQLAADWANQCQRLGSLNWNMMARIYLAYKWDVSIRKAMIRRLATNLTEDPGNFSDIHGDSVRIGAEKTLRKNLNIGVDDADSVSMEMFNSMAQGECATEEIWLPEVHIYPHVFFADFDFSGGKCEMVTSLLRKSNNPDENIPITLKKNPSLMSDPYYAKLVDNYLKEGIIDSNDPHLRPSLGFEKNPWCMSYVGVKATMVSRKPFGPFGDPVVLTAKSYAKPFGGRIGPWYGKAWPRGGMQSVAANESQRTDPRTSPRVTDGFNFITGVVNYSRYPGDPYGMRSVLAQGAFRIVWGGVYNSASDLRPAYGFYDTVGDYQAMVETGNVLATVTPPSLLREIEAAAVAPDLFDITYYSIEPQFYRAYFGNQVAQNLFENMQQNMKPISDIGSRVDEETFIAYGVKNQIESSLRLVSAGLPEMFYMIKDPDHILTAWDQKGAADYGFPGDLGRCMDGAKPSGLKDAPPAPGDCFAGGRVGYSVKLVNEKYLLRENFQLGGTDLGAGPILNPPTDF